MHAYLGDKDLKTVLLTTNELINSSNCPESFGEGTQDVCEKKENFKDLSRWKRSKSENAPHRVSRKRSPTGKSKMLFTWCEFVASACNTERTCK